MCRWVDGDYTLEGMRCLRFHLRIRNASILWIHRVNTYLNILDEELADCIGSAKCQLDSLLDLRVWYCFHYNFSHDFNGVDIILLAATRARLFRLDRLWMPNAIIHFHELPIGHK